MPAKGTRTSAYERVMRKVIKDHDCMMWTGARTGSTKVNGQSVYGVIRGENGQPRGVHRVVWEHEVGPIPEGMTLDHLCENHVCVNVDHLQLATRSKNTELRWVRNPAPDVCSRGHSNWRMNIVRPGKEAGRTVRRCRDCQAGK